MLGCFPRRPKGPGGDILDRGGSGGMCAPSTSVEDFAAMSAHATWSQVCTTGTVRVKLLDHRPECSKRFNPRTLASPTPKP